MATSYRRAPLFDQMLPNYAGDIGLLANPKLVARIKVGTEPHGLTVWPQPGRYSLGHTGNTR